jgi:hypothetical protein
MPISVDVIDDVLLLGPALRAVVAAQSLPVFVRHVSPSWMDYASHLESAAESAVVRAELLDHVPTVLKVRALARLGARVIVVASDPSRAHVERLLEAGAWSVLDRGNTLADILQNLMGGARPVTQATHASHPVPTQPVHAIHLSDRELQIACLYVGRTAPSTTMLASLLSLPLSSTRTHLQRARRALTVGGPASTRAQLRQRLREEGWTDVFA